MIDKAKFSFWFPAIVAAGVPYPKTEIIKTDLVLLDLLDGKKPKGWDGFLAEVRGACDKIGYPCFLKTGVFSSKHGWRGTCYIEGPEVLARHISRIIEDSELADMLGLPTDEWIVRELLPTVAPFTSHDGMPVTKERRYFIRPGEVLCHHPYWPQAAIRTEVPEKLWRPQLDALNEETLEEIEELTRQSLRVSVHLDGVWSLDWLHATTGWHAIDMAPAARSFHWEGCPLSAKSILEAHAPKVAKSAGLDPV